MFNQRIACYEIGFAFLRDRAPQYRHLLEHLRDANAERLGVQTSDIYRLLTHVPERVTRAELRKQLKEDGNWDALDKLPKNGSAVRLHNRCH